MPPSSINEPVPILVIDDDPLAISLVKGVLLADRYRVVAADTAHKGLELLSKVQPAVIILDVKLPDMNGLDTLADIQRLDRDIPVIMLTGSMDIRTAVDAMKAGAFHYLPKPVEAGELALVVERALERTSLLREVRDLRTRATPEAAVAERMGPSPAIRQLANHVGRAAKSGLTVLILGETGTGKEVVAQAVHQASARSKKPLVAVDCGAIPESLLESELFGHEKGAFTGADRRREGLFHAADGGTLFLDEIGNLPTTLQAKLLRVMESREYKMVGGAKASRLDVRFLAATQTDLRKRVAGGTFREDLYFRLAQYPITVPPLRERVGDLPHLARRFLREASAEMHGAAVDFEPEALEALALHRWPGNVRELRNVVRLAVLHAERTVIDAALVRALINDVDVAATPQGLRDSAFRPPRLGGRSLRAIADEAARAAERAAIARALAETHGNKSAAARLLHTDYKTLLTKAQRYGLGAAVNGDRA